MDPVHLDVLFENFKPSYRDDAGRRAYGNYRIVKPAARSIRGW